MGLLNTRNGQRLLSYLGEIAKQLKRTNDLKEKADNNPKPTGIVRRIDDLGRVVIPSEIRNDIGIKEGCPFEIFTLENGDVLFRKLEG